jgi:hypothetical protein
MRRPILKNRTVRAEISIVNEVRKNSSVVSFNNLMDHKIQQKVILFYVFAPYILIQLSNVYQRNVHFSN